MTININGVYREMTSEEIAEHERIFSERPQAKPSMEEKLAARSAGER